MTTLRVGASKKSVLPSEEMLKAGRIYLWGNHDRVGPAESVRDNDNLWARSLAVSDKSGTCVVLVSLDVCALDPEFTERVRERVLASRNLAPERVAINVTHTHNAPVTLNVPTWDEGFDRADPEYVVHLEDRVVASIEEAVDARVAASLKFGRCEIDLGENRRDRLRPYDRNLDVLQATDEDGKTIAVAFFHGCHPVFLRDDRRLSADFPGVACDRIEGALDGGSRDIVALFFQGFGGTINPYPDFTGEGPMVAFGNRVADAVLGQLDGEMTVLVGPIRGRLKDIEIPLRAIDQRAIDGILSRREELARRGNVTRSYLRWAEHYRGTNSEVRSTLPTQLQAIHVGPVTSGWCLVASSHEVVAEFTAPVRDAWREFEHVTLMGYTNGQMSYLPTREVSTHPPGDFPDSEERNYEGRDSFASVYGHPGPLADEVDDVYLEGHGALARDVAS